MHGTMRQQSKQHDSPTLILLMKQLALNLVRKIQPIWTGN
jgi:hypothetical protein